VKAIVKNLEQILRKKGTKLFSKAVTPMQKEYKPKLDESEELDKNGISMYQEFILGELC
jgi:hypothetical protein